MTKPALAMPRRLAIALLHEAQVAAPARVGGLVGSGGQGPVGFLPLRNLAAEGDSDLAFDRPAALEGVRLLTDCGQTLWAVYGSHPARAGEPDLAELLASPFPEALYLALSLNIKGVLQMRAWRLGPAGPVESMLVVQD